MNKDILIKIKKHIDLILPEVVKIRHHLHKHPEIALKEYTTSKYIREKLKPLDLKTLSPFIETDVVAILNHNHHHKNITLRADIDALPLDEKTELPYKSENNGFMHACGHDGHTAMLIGAAMVLNEMKDNLNGSVRFVFQPGEEEVAGGKILVDKGALLDPKPDAVLALHGWNGIPQGCFSSKSGALTSAADFFKITVKGKGGHGASPQLTIDPILTISKIIDSINHITSRKISALDSAVISICHVESGKNSNIIPDSAMLEGTVRYFEKEVGKDIPDLIDQTVRGICDSVGAEYDLSYHKPYVPMIVDENIYNFSKNIVTDVFGKNNWDEMKNPLMGAEDFAYFIEDYPGAMLRLGLGKEYAALHNPHFDFNDNVLKDGIMFFAAATIDFLS